MGKWVGAASGVPTSGSAPTLTFDAHPEGRRDRGAVHPRGLAGPSEFMAHCSARWAYFLLSLKSLVETGKGTPFPEDLKF